jgi:hypothetical protein
MKSILALIPFFLLNLVNLFAQCPASPANQTISICSGVALNYEPTPLFDVATDYTWTVINNTNVTGEFNEAVPQAALNQTLVNLTNSPQDVIYILTANCGTNPTVQVTVTVNPIPTLTSNLTSSVCSGSLFIYFANSSTSGATFSWTRAAVAGISNPSGSGVSPNISEVLANTTSIPIEVIYVFTLDVNGCNNSQDVIVTVNPTPILSSALTTAALCSGDVFTYNATSPTPFALFNWTCALVAGISNPSSSGVGPNISEVLANTTSNPINVTYVFTLSANGCINSQNVTVTINPIPELSSTQTPTAICSGNLFNYTATSLTTGTNFSWDRPIVTDINNNQPSNGSNANISETMINGSVSPIPVLYNFTIDANGCSNNQTVTVIINPSPTISINPSQTNICFGTKVYCEANSQNGGDNPAYQWQLNGNNIGTNSPYFNHSHLNHNDSINCLIVSSDGCNPVISNYITMTVNSNNFNPNFTSAQTNLSTPPFVADFTNNTPNPNDYNFVWNFGDGISSTQVNPTHQYQSNGTYHVTLQAIDTLTGCIAFIYQPGYITCSNGNNCNYNVTLNHSGTINGCIGGALQLIATTDATNPLYQWTRDGIAIGGATQNYYHAKVSGSYTVIVYDSLGCTIPSETVVVNFANPASIVPTISKVGELTTCTPSLVTLTASALGADSIRWNTGATSSVINVSQSGYYSVTAYYGIGCQSTSIPLAINGSNAPNPGICLVSVDTVTNKNLIVWETPLTTEITNLHIYKESLIPNVFSLIDSVPYNSLSEFIDLGSNANEQGFRYQLVVSDDCQKITLPGFVYKTIHLKVFPGESNNNQLSWSDYEGPGLSYFEIWRRPNGGSFQLLDSVAASQNTYVDINPPFANAEYKIEVVLAQTCNSVDRAAYGKSKSNVGNNQIIPTIGIKEKDAEYFAATLIPNPSDGNTILQWESLKAQNLQIVVTDVVGKVVLADKVNAQKGSNKFAIEVDAAGVYFVTIYDVNGSKNVLKMVVR